VGQEKVKEYNMSYEGKMARASLRKTAMYSTELLKMIGINSELDAWVQDKISQIDHNIEAVYGYYKFGEKEEAEESEIMEVGPLAVAEAVKQMAGEETYMDSDGQVTIGDYTTKHFDICPSAQKLYSSIKDKTVMIHLIVETMMLQDLLFRLEKQAIAQGSIDSDDMEKAEEFAELVMDNAKQMNLESEHSYIEEVHLAKFRELAGVSNSNEEDEDEEMEYEDMEMSNDSLFVTIKHQLD
jgi:hypothetical protein